MDFQTLIVVIVIALALGFVGTNFWRKIKSFSTKANCGNDCGCDSSSGKKLTRIHRN